MRYVQLFLIFAVSVFLLPSCWPTATPSGWDTIYAVKNETSYSIVLSFYLFNKDTPIDLTVNSTDRYAEINMDNLFGRANWGIDSVMVFNLSDTTSVLWSAIPPPNESVFNSFFRSLFGRNMPQWITTPEDSIKWEISRKSWSPHLVDDWHEKRLLTVTLELLGIMRKDYSMLQRFPEFYE